MSKFVQELSEYADLVKKFGRANISNNQNLVDKLTYLTKDWKIETIISVNNKLNTIPRPIDNATTNSLIRSNFLNKLITPSHNIAYTHNKKI